ncbi:ATP synthase F0 subunit B [Amylibacter sp.]|nr:ATP synthase F0 subunit B [Amylibacter sp.]
MSKSKIHKLLSIKIFPMLASIFLTFIIASPSLAKLSYENLVIKPFDTSKETPGRVYNGTSIKLSNVQLYGKPLKKNTITFEFGGGYGQKVRGIEFSSKQTFSNMPQSVSQGSYTDKFGYRFFLGKNNTSKASNVFNKLDPEDKLIFKAICGALSDETFVKKILIKMKTHTPTASYEPINLSRYIKYWAMPSRLNETIKIANECNRGLKNTGPEKVKFTLTEPPKLCGVRTTGVLLNSRTFKSIQSDLKSLGHYNGKIDGLFGAGSCKSLAAYNSSIGKTVITYYTKYYINSLTERAIAKLSNAKTSETENEATKKEAAILNAIKKEAAEIVKAAKKEATAIVEAAKKEAEMLKAARKETVEIVEVAKEESTEKVETTKKEIEILEAPKKEANVTNELSDSSILLADNITDEGPKSPNTTNGDEKELKENIFQDEKSPTIKQTSFDIPKNLNPVDFKKISFSNTIFKNTYLDGSEDYEKFYNGTALSIYSTPQSIDFGSLKDYDKKDNEACYGESSYNFSYEFCAFIFTDNISYYWASSNDTKDIYAKSQIFRDDEINFVNKCDEVATTGNSALGYFFGIGSVFNSEKYNSYSDALFDDAIVGIRSNINDIIEICENEITLNPNLGRNYTNLYVIKKLSYVLSMENNEKISDSTLNGLVELLDNAVNSESPDNRAYYYMGLLNRDGFEYSYGEYQRPSDDRYKEETWDWMLNFVYAFNTGNLNVINDFVRFIQKKAAVSDTYYFKMFVENYWETDFVQSFFMNFKYELASAGSFTNLLEEGNDDALRDAIKNKILTAADDYMLIILSDYIVDKIDVVPREEYFLDDLSKTVELMKDDKFLERFDGYWKKLKLLKYTNHFVTYTPENSSFFTKQEMIIAYDSLRWQYENLNEIDKAYANSKKAVQLYYDSGKKWFNESDLTNHSKRLERKTLANVPLRVKINFYCTSDMWVNDQYIEMEAGYGPQAVEAALKMNVLNNAYAMDSFKSTPYLCDFKNQRVVLKNNIRFWKIYDNNKIIVQIKLPDGKYIYSYINA